ncbi:hypothetical protein SAMN04487905_1256 [Actinopolyspora xinjiangensis]|uniref:O-methyltransferase dimerisation domain-containing protein n=1 Tax=Actinopolyspora xinjiangensis TaxID=405564 RepID=A0A1H0X2Y8_9ACTN|nr:hypothetical protein [Actinopolyspora xinjiangensis]SDP97301.1 hypothetical protein SAMN04487905_1256 [Actinopolyspora xinjiangensis]
MSTETHDPFHDIDGEVEPFRLALVYAYSGHLLRAAVRLGLPDAVGAEATSVPELADRTGTRPELLRRLLRALTLLGVFRTAGEDAYERTPLSGSCGRAAALPGTRQRQHLAGVGRTGRGNSHR